MTTGAEEPINLRVLTLGQERSAVCLPAALGEGIVRDLVDRA
jgi:hypothetical protein